MKPHGYSKVVFVNDLQRRYKLKSYKKGGNVTQKVKFDLKGRTCASCHATLYGKTHKMWVMERCSFQNNQSTLKFKKVNLIFVEGNRK